MTLLSLALSLHKRFILFGCVDAVVADGGLDDGDFVAVFEGAELF